MNNLVPGKTTAKQAQLLENGEINPFTNKPFTSRYRTIMQQRLSLPVHKQRDDFLNLVHNNQIIVFVGETGSGNPRLHLLIKQVKQLRYHNLWYMMHSLKRRVNL